MSLKRRMENLTLESPPPPVSVPRRRATTKSRHSRRTVRHGESSCFPVSRETSLPLASAPRTVEIMWGGSTAPGFMLKRKRTGAILVSSVTDETHDATKLNVGSELKLVGGFPVNRLTLQDVKKVMLLAPKPVSLVFVNADDVVIGSFDNYLNTEETSEDSTASSSASTTLFSHNMQRSRSLNMSYVKANSVERSDSVSSLISAPTFYSKPSENNRSKKRKVSKLQEALDRVNQLLNRPVRQAGLHVALGKSIVV